MLLLEDRRFYVYIYLDPTKSGRYKYGEYEFEYEPFYVGKGKGKRYLIHLYKCISRNRLKYNKIMKIKKLGYEPIIKMYKYLTEKESFEHEIILIKSIGRRDKKLGTLTNMTEGGQGPSGFKHNKKTILKAVKKRKGKLHVFFGKPRSLETRRKISQAQIGKHLSEETKRKIGNIHRGKHVSEESKKKISINHYCSRAVIINDKQYRSIKDAGRKLDIHRNTLLYRIRNNLIDSKFVISDEEYFSKHPILPKTKPKYNKGRSKQIIINDVVYNSLKEASKKLNVKYDFIRYRLRNKNFSNYKYAQPYKQTYNNSL